MPARYAFVTLLTSDAYLPGALTVAGALKDVHRSLSSDQVVEYDTVCLVTPETLDVTTIKLLRRAFDLVIGVEVIVQPDAGSLSLLGRPDLDTVLTKLHVFRLTQYSKVIFLDADVLPLRPLSHLFLLDHEFSAVPDVGWPDIFNSGVVVLSPGQDKFNELRELLNTKGSWDGADQGLLNEWRGNNWNRLSFTYNTTPTAAYTYAPAYQRFGSRISAVHFIGPLKPWHSIAFRAPGSFAQTSMSAESASTETLAIQQCAYDYGSLVDRWYHVYDRHYRSQAVQPDFQFEPRRYTSAWNEEDSYLVASGAFGLDELRRFALEGMGASGLPAPRAAAEGEYRTMPLEGRFDLMRPRTRAEKKQEQLASETSETPESEPVPVQAVTPMASVEPSTPVGQIVSLPSGGSPVRWATLPTPGVDELPPAPQTRLMSLPPTPLHFVPAPYQPLPTTRNAGAQTVPTDSQWRAGGSSTPALLVWTPAIETPPRSVGTPSPTDNYFPHVWDFIPSSSSISSPSSETSNTTMEGSPSKPQPTSNALFNAPPTPAIPEMLHRQAHYRNVWEGSGSPTPDPAKVKRVFPWEERPRHAPGRVFPEEEVPSTAIVLQSITAPATPDRKTGFVPPMPSPLFGFPLSLQSSHRLDTPFLQRHAGKLPRSMPASSPLAPRFKASSKTFPSLERAETESQDGDIEDEVDSEEEALVRSRSRSSSVGKAKYRSIGIQTDPRDLHEEGVQVATFGLEGISGPNWSPSNGAGVSRPVVTTGVSSAAGTRDSNHSSPALDSPQVLTPSKSPDRLVVFTTPEPKEVHATEPSREDSPGSPMLSMTAHPDGRTRPQARKGSRVWDATRGVEVFKRESEEVLARFLKMGSWEGRR